MCNGILQRQIHHGPSRGGATERKKFEDWYDKTLEFYRITFNQDPPTSIWPHSEERFSDVHFNRVNVKKELGNC